MTVDDLEVELCGVVVIDERSRSTSSEVPASACRTLDQPIADGRLSNRSALIDQDGRLRQENVRVDGPISNVERVEPVRPVPYSRGTTEPIVQLPTDPLPRDQAHRRRRRGRGGNPNNGSTRASTRSRSPSSRKLSPTWRKSLSLSCGSKPSRSDTWITWAKEGGTGATTNPVGTEFLRAAAAPPLECFVQDVLIHCTVISTATASRLGHYGDHSLHVTQVSPCCPATGQPGKIPVQTGLLHGAEVQQRRK